jgi:hypothetical protein
VISSQAEPDHWLLSMADAGVQGVVVRQAADESTRKEIALRLGKAFADALADAEAARDAPAVDVNAALDKLRFDFPQLPTRELDAITKYLRCAVWLLAHAKHALTPAHQQNVASVADAQD